MNQRMPCKNDQKLKICPQQICPEKYSKFSSYEPENAMQICLEIENMCIANISREVLKI